MGKAWPRFLPEATRQAIAHALIIEANAMVVEQLAEGQAELIAAHDRAEAYARAHYSPEDIRAAWNACATAPDNSNILLHHLVKFCATSAPARENLSMEQHSPARAATKRLPPPSARSRDVIGKRTFDVGLRPSGVLSATRRQHISTAKWPPRHQANPLVTS
jgi:hypothetical protein